MNRNVFRFKVGDRVRCKVRIRKPHGPEFAVGTVVFVAEEKKGIIVRHDMWREGWSVPPYDSKPRYWMYFRGDAVTKHEPKRSK